MSRADREIGLLEQQLEDARAEGDWESERSIAAEIRDIEREEFEREQWEERGRERGWT